MNHQPSSQVVTRAARRNVFSSTSARLSAAAALVLALGAHQASAATVAMAPTGITVKVSTLTIGAGNVLNIASGTNISTNPAVVSAARNGVIWEATSAASQAANFLYAYNNVVSGFNGGGWDGTTGILSTVASQDAFFGTGALGVMTYDNTLLGYTQWQGKAVTDTVNFYETMMRLTYLGDFTGDGRITVDDFLTEISYGGDPATYKVGDLNGDGAITSDDYLTMIASGTQPYGALGDAQALAAPAAPAPAPEPTSGLLLLLGTAGLAGLRKRKPVQ